MVPARSSRAFTFTVEMKIGQPRVKKLAVPCDLNVWYKPDFKTADVHCKGEMIAFLRANGNDVHDVDEMMLGNFYYKNGSPDVVVWNTRTKKKQYLIGHTFNVVDVAWDPSGQWLASCSEDKTLKIWSAGECVKTLEGHKRPVLCLSWSPNGNLLASGSRDTTVKIWDPITGKCVKTLEGHVGSVSGLSWSQTGQLASGGYTTVKIWDVKDGKCMKTFDPNPNPNHWVTILSWCPFGQKLAIGGGYSDLSIWSATQNFDLYSTWQYSGTPLLSIEWTKDGQWLLSLDDTFTLTLRHVQTAISVTEFKLLNRNPTPKLLNPKVLKLLSDQDCSHKMRLRPRPNVRKKNDFGSSGDKSDSDSDWEKEEEEEDDSSGDDSQGLNTSASLDSEQERAVFAPTNQHLCISAGPGSGKTHVLTERVLHICTEHPYASVLAITFTRKAAKELKERVEQRFMETVSTDQFFQPNLEVRTFHAACFSMLVDYNNGQPPRILSNKEKEDLLRTAYEQLMTPEKSNMQETLEITSTTTTLVPVDKKQLTAWTLEMSRAKAQGDDQLNDLLKKPIFRQYERLRAFYSYVDYDDILLEARNLLRTGLMKGKDFVLVDEFQDTNQVQYDIVKALVNLQPGPSTQRGSSTDSSSSVQTFSTHDLSTKRSDQRQGKDFGYVSVVGDVDQLIYSWRSARVETMDHFIKDFDPFLVRLRSNYRSLPKICNQCCDILGRDHDAMKSKKKLKKGGESLAGNVFTMTGRDPRDEARRIARYIRNQSSGTKRRKKSENQALLNYSDFAILVRMNDYKEHFERAFDQMGIPFNVAGEGGNIASRTSFRDCVAFLSLFFNPRDTLAWKRIINKPKRGIGEKMQERLMEMSYDEETGEVRDILTTIRILLDNADGGKNAQTRISTTAMNGMRTFLDFMENVRSDFGGDRSDFGGDVEETNLAIVLDKLLHESGYLEHHYNLRDSEDGKASRDALKSLQIISFFRDTLRNVNTEAQFRALSADLGNIDEGKYMTRDDDDNDQKDVQQSYKNQNNYKDGNKDEECHYLQKGYQSKRNGAGGGKTHERKNSSVHMMEKGVTISTIHGAKGLQWDTVFVAGINSPYFPAEWAKNYAEEKRLLYVASSRAASTLVYSSVDTHAPSIFWPSDLDNTNGKS
eukprot:g2736.t1